MRVSVLLAIVGCGAALLTALEDFARIQLKSCMIAMIGTEPSPASREHYVLFSMGCAATACALTHFLCPAAAGSGVPEMKTILSGVVKPSLLTGQALIAKFFGLVLALAAGLSVGQEGPNVHVACALADILMRRLHCFHAIVINESKRLDVLGAACAAGVAASFGTPFGGAIFSIEITASTYNIAMLPQALWCAMAGALALESAGLDKLTSIFDPNNTSEGLSSKRFSSSSPSRSGVFGDPTLIDLVSFVALGLVCGLLGCAFVAVVSSLARLRNDILSTRRFLLAKKLTIVLFGTLLVAPWVFEDLILGLAGTRASSSGNLSSYGESSSSLEHESNNSNDDVFEVLFQKKPMDDATRLKTFWFVPYKLFITIVSVVLPLPVGVFKPTFTTGAAVGRALGELLHSLTAHLAESLNDSGETAVEDSNTPFTRFLPWEFAVIGAAAFAAGVTRALSSAVIFLELAGENHLKAPLLIATLVAHFIGNRFTKPIYDALIDTNGTPTLPDLPARCYYLPARAVMHPVLEVSIFCEAINRRRRGDCQRLVAVPADEPHTQTEFHEWRQLPGSNNDPRFSDTATIKCDSKAPTEVTSLNGRGMSNAERLLRRFSMQTTTATEQPGTLCDVDEELSPDTEESDEGEWTWEDIEEDEPIPFIRLDSTYFEVRQLLDARNELRYLRALTSIPVVQDADQQALVGSVLLDDLVSTVHAFEDMLALARRDPILVGNPRSQNASSLDVAIGTGCDRVIRVDGSSSSGALSSSSGRRPTVQNQNCSTSYHSLSFARQAFVDEGMKGRAGPRVSRSKRCFSEIQVDTCAAAGDETVLLLGSTFRENDSFCVKNGHRQYHHPQENHPNSSLHWDAWQAGVRFVVNHGGRALPVAAADADHQQHSQNVSHRSIFFAYAPEVSLLLDASPYQILDTMVLAKVDLIFRTLKVNHAHVTCSGVLVGVVTRARLRRVLAEDTKASSSWCRQFCCGDTQDGCCFSSDDEYLNPTESSRRHTHSYTSSPASYDEVGHPPQPATGIPASPPSRNTPRSLTPFSPRSDDDVTLDIDNDDA